MRRFHIGILATEIVSIVASSDATYPTRYTLRNGSTVNSTGEWQENVKAVERLLARMERDGSKEARSILEDWSASGRNYLKSDERRRLWAALGMEDDRA